MNNTLYKKIYKKIKQYNEIVIARHIGPDPDAVTSQIALRDSIKATFPNKKVYAVGQQVSRFRIYGDLDKLEEDSLTNALLIVVDVPNLSRIEGVDYTKCKEIIKIDHHPYEDKMGELEIVDPTSCSAAQLITELIMNTKLKMPKEVAQNLFCGIVSDSDRFLLSYTTPKTFKVVEKLLNYSKIDIQKEYIKLYERPMNEIRFQGYIAENMIVTENGFGYIKITSDDIKNFDVDSSTPSNMVNNFNYIKEVVAWAFVTYDDKNELYKVNIRSRGPVINTVASKYNGGGHIYAAGVRSKSMEEIDKLIDDLDKTCKEYKEKQV